MTSYVKFWEDWEDKSVQEVAAIKTVEEVRSVILGEVLNSKIHSIYIKGSFVRREMNKDSDVDIVVIINDNEYLLEIEKLEDKYKDAFDVPLGISVKSLWELENNKHFHKPEGPKATPFLFLRKVGNYKLSLL